VSNGGRERPSDVNLVVGKAMAAPLNWRSSASSRLLGDAVRHELAVDCSAHRHLQIVSRRDVSYHCMRCVEPRRQNFLSGDVNGLSSPMFERT
jgi:hypothetical protein